MPNPRTISSTVHCADRLIAKKGDIKTNIRNLDARNQICADVLAHEGHIEATVRNAMEHEDAEAWHEFESFLHQQREKVKSITESHIHLNRKLNAFIGAVEEVKGEIIAKQSQSQSQQQNDEDSKPLDYEIIVRTKMELMKQAIDDQSGPIDKDPWMTRTRNKLREPAASANGNDDEEDDVQVAFSNQESSNEYKCPITGGFMENPMKSTVCGHVYNYDGIKFYIGSRRSRKCPVPGCSNSSLSMNELEEDIEMQLRVKRHLRRMEQERQQRMSQTEDIDDF